MSPSLQVLILPQSKAGGLTQTWGLEEEEYGQVLEKGALPLKKRGATQVEGLWNPTHARLF